jgi:hypothetical protein
MGGAFASPGRAAQFKIAGNTVHIKAGNYTCSGTANVAGGRVNDTTIGTAPAPNKWLGYETTREDGGAKPVLIAGASTMTLFTASGAHTWINNLEFKRDTGAGFTAITGLNISGTSSQVKSCKATSCDGTGIIFGASRGYLRQSEANACDTGIAANNGTFLSCTVRGSTGTGITNAGNPVTLVRCIVTAAAVRGIDLTISGSMVLHSTVHGTIGASGNGIRLAADGVLAINCVCYDNSQTDYAGVASNRSTRLINCTGEDYDTTNLTAAQVEGFITLTADPFTNAAGLDFSLNDAAGGGALLKGVGFPESFPGLAGVSYPDVGAYQSISGGGSGGSGDMATVRTVGALVGTNETTGVDLAYGTPVDGAIVDVLGDDTSRGTLWLYLSFTGSAAGEVKVTISNCRVTGQTYYYPNQKFTVDLSKGNKQCIGIIQASRYMCARLEASISSISLSNAALLYELEKIT